MRRQRAWWILAAGLALGSGTAHAGGETIIPLTGEVPDDGLDHFFVPFDVPAGGAVVEIEVRHDDLSDANVLDWGLQGPDGFRGWGGGNAEPAIVGVDAASRSYSPGAIEAGQWEVIVGKALIDEPPGNYALEVVLRATATLPPQARTPYVDAAALAEGPAWYAGDFHVHSEQSGDAQPSLDDIGTFARDRGLDFVLISDHNVNTAQDFFVDLQPEHPELLFIPGVEFTTYAGHANGIGATQWVDHKIGQPGVSIEGAIAAFHDQGAVFSINHPAFELGALCIGCAWNHEVDGATIDGVEIASNSLQPLNAQFTAGAIALWDEMCAQGYHVAAIGGSDDHKAGVDLSAFQSPIGDATTLVWAERLDVPSIVQGVRDGRTVVKLQGPDDPTLTFDAVEPIEGDTIVADEVTLVAQVTGAAGQEIRWVQNGTAEDLQVIDADPFELQRTVAAPADGQDRYRVEVFVDGERRVVASHLWVEASGEAGDTGGTVDGTTGGGGDGAGSASGPMGADTGSSGTEGAAESDSSGGCGCRSSTGAPAGGWWLVMWGLGGLAVARRGRRPAR
jgi:MYXO-CTERM domain-containing protein